MADYRIVINTQNSSTDPVSALKDAWVYWSASGSIITLRSDEQGNLKSLRSGGNALLPWDYTEFFVAAGSTSVGIFFTRSGRALTSAFLQANAALFQLRNVPATASSTVSSSTSAQVTAGSTTTVTIPASVSITVNSVACTITQPQDLTLWPLLWQQSHDTYYTDGINQGAALWNAASALTVIENDPAPAPANTVRPKPRGLKVRGTIDSTATSIQIQLLTNTGAIINLLTNPASATPVDSITGMLGAISGSVKPFETVLFLADPASAFGPVQLIVKPQGTPLSFLIAVSLNLVGIQAALVNDYGVNVDGTQPGTLQGEANESIVVDYLISPGADAGATQAQTRARRMVCHQFANRNRQLSTPASAVVSKPEMPLWMVEGQIIGIDQAQIEDLMRRRKHMIAAAPAILAIEWQFKLNLAWDGPDSATTSARRYQYTQDFTHTLTSSLSIDALDKLEDVVATTGEVAGAINPLQAEIPFPVAGRRLAKMFVSGHDRAWGRLDLTATRSALVVEWQPRIVNAADEEILRGGDATLTIEQVSIDGVRIDRGIVITAGNPASPPVDTPDVQLPTIRVRGLNPVLPLDDLINACVQEYYDNNSTAARITFLSLACWQETIRLIFNHESSGMHFDGRASAIRRYAGQYYGFEHGMPIFGPPHGYGLGQLDNPRVTDSAAWSFIENIRESVRRIMADKASSAYTLISTHLPSPLDQRIRAVYQREIVRRYNGGREFSWLSGSWQINPSVNQWMDPADHTKGPNPRLLYPNQVLGTSVVYSNGSGSATTFPWPITFTSTDLGPGT